MACSYVAVVFIIIFLVGVSSASILDYFRPDKWNDLKITWGPSPFRYFNSMPRDVHSAARDGFDMVGECDGDPNFRGVPYVKDGDTSLILLYDVNGYIAGMQTIVPDGMPFDYPSRGLTPPFVQTDNGFYLTVYFVPPDTICSGGRSHSEFREQGTGTALLIQNGTNPEIDYITVPQTESGLEGTRWVQGKCFPTMGLHYWYDISQDMNCDRFFPMFLLYNNEELNGFGWALGANLPSPRLEHPPSRLYGMFMKEPPRCLYERGTLSTMHIYLTSRPALNLC